MEQRKTIRFRLVVMLWLLAGVTFVTVDLFRNVSAFDGVRPEWKSYRAARYAAHKMVDEPFRDGGFAESLPGRRDEPALRTLRAGLWAVEQDETFEELAERARGAGDPRVRIRAFRRLAREHPSDAGALLDGLARDLGQTLKIRAQAARYLAWTGDVAGAASFTQPRVRRWAEQGLAELGTANAARVLVDRNSDQLARVSNAVAIPVLAEAARKTPHACTALGRTTSPDAVEPLVRVLADKGVHPTIRAEAAAALGRLGLSAGRAAVDAACTDPWPAVVQSARRAQQRLNLQ